MYGVTFTCDKDFNGYVRVITPYSFESADAALRCALDNLDSPTSLAPDLADHVYDSAGKDYNGPWYALVETEDLCLAEVGPERVTFYHHENVIRLLQT